MIHELPRNQIFVASRKKYTQSHSGEIGLLRPFYYKHLSSGYLPKNDNVYYFKPGHTCSTRQ